MSLPRTRLRSAALLGLSALALQLLGLVVQGAFFVELAQDVGWTAASLAALATALTMSRRAGEPRLRRAWRMWTIATACWAAGVVYLDVVDVLGVSVDRLPVDAVWWLGGLALVIGIVRRVPLAEFAVWPFVLDAIPIAAALLGLARVVTHLLYSDPVRLQVTSGLYVLAYAPLIVPVVNLVAFEGRRAPREIVPLAAGIVALIAASQSWALSLHDQTAHQVGYSDLLWTVGFVGISTSAWLGRGSSSAPRERLNESPLISLLAALCSGGLGALLILSRSSYHPVLYGCFLAAAAALSVRFYLSSRLSERRLEAWIREQGFSSAIVESAASLIVVLDPRGHVIRWNRACTRDTGVPAEEARRRPIWEVFPGRDDESREEWVSALAQVEGTRGEVELEAEWLSPAGRHFAMWSLIPLHDADGRTGAVIANGLDVTDRRFAELRLSASEARLRGVFAATPLALCVVDEMGSIVEVNRAAEQMFDFEGPEITGRRLTELTHPDDAAETRELFLQLMRGELKSYQTQDRYLRRDGRVFWGRLTVARIPDEDGNARHAIGTMEDVTREIETAEALRERTETLQAIVQSSSIAIVTLDREGRVTLWNPAAETIFGWRREEALGQFFPIVGPEHEAQFRTFFAHNLSGGTFLDMDIERRRKDGSAVSLRVSSAGLRNSSGEVIGVIAMLADVTERVRAEAALREAEDRFRHAFEEAPTGIALESLDGTWLRVNRALCEILGHSAEELVGRSFLDMTHPDDVAANLEQLEAGRAGEAPRFHIEKRYIRADGETIWAEVAASVVRDADGEPAYFIAQIDDVTERRRVADALRESEEALQDLFDSAAELIQVVSPDGRFLFVNRAWRQTLGYTEEEMATLTVEDVLSPTCRDTFLATLAQVMEGETADRIEAVFRAKGGRLVDVEGNASCRVRHGRPVAARAIFRDVSQRKLTERALADSAARLRTIFETAAEGIVTIDERGTIDTVNGTMAELFGYAPEELVGRNISTLMPEPERGDHDGDLHHYLDTGRQRVTGGGREATGLRRDGTTFPMEVLVSEMTIGGRRMFTGMLRDITERKQAARALEETATRLQTIFDTAAEGIVTIDEEGTVDGMNRAAAELFGYEPEDVVGKNLSILLPEVLQGRHASYFDRHPQAEAEARGIMGRVREISGRRRDGTVFPIEIVVNEMQLGTRRMFTSLIRDITLRKQVEQEREQRLIAEQEARRVLAEQNEQLLNLDRMKDDFVSLVSHELRTPLTSIVGYVELLRDEEAGPLEAEQHRFLDVVQRSCDRLLRLVGDLLVLMQINSDALKIELAELDLATIIADSLESARPLAEQKEIALVASVAQLPHLTGDRVRLAQVLDNLISNAVKFTPGGGRVEVRARRTGNCVVVEVADTGAGIPAGEQAGVFGRFFRSSTAMKNQVPGTGLGLVITKAIVEKHEGTIEFESEAGVGTTFTITLPVLRELATPASDQAGEQAA